MNINHNHPSPTNLPSHWVNAEISSSVSFNDPVSHHRVARSWSHQSVSKVFSKLHRPFSSLSSACITSGLSKAFEFSGRKDSYWSLQNRGALSFTSSTLGIVKPVSLLPVLSRYKNVDPEVLKMTSQMITWWQVQRCSYFLAHVRREPPPSDSGSRLSLWGSSSSSKGVGLGSICTQNPGIARKGGGLTHAKIFWWIW